jgi:hypothetical protein
MIWGQLFICVIHFHIYCMQRCHFPVCYIFPLHYLQCVEPLLPSPLFFQGGIFSTRVPYFAKRQTPLEFHMAAKLSSQQRLHIICVHAFPISSPRIRLNLKLLPPSWPAHVTVIPMEISRHPAAAPSHRVEPRWPPTLYLINCGAANCT